MKKIILTALLVPAVALAQTYPSPTFNSVILQNPLSQTSGGTGTTTSTGTGSLVLNTSPALVTPNLGTPSTVMLMNGSGLPLSTGITGFGTGVAAGLANPATGSGSPVLGASPTIESPTVTGSLTATGLVSTADLATQAANTVLANAGASTASPTAVPLPSCSGTNQALNWMSDTGFSCQTIGGGAIGTVTSVAASGGATGLTFTGSPITTSGTLTLGGTLNVANGGTGTTTSTGTGSVVLNTSPTLVTPALGTPSSVVLTHGTGLPVSTGVSGLGTGVATALTNPVTGSGDVVLATAPTVASATLSTPTITGGTINNSPVGASTPSTGAFTALSSTSPPTVGTATIYPTVPSNAALKALPTTAAPYVIRETFSATQSAPPITYAATSAACTLNSGAGDNGSQVAGANGYCWDAVFPSGPLDYREWGVYANGATDDSAAIQSAINYVNGLGGGTLLISGWSAAASPISADNTIDVRLVGKSYVRNSGNVSGFVYTGSTGARFFSARGSNGFQMSNLAVQYNNSGFTGILVDLTGTVSVETLYYSFDHDLIGLYNGLQTAQLLNINGSANGSFRNVVFSAGSYQVGLTTSANTANDFANGISFENCEFSGSAQIPIQGGGMSVSFYSNTFEPMASGAPGAWNSGATYAQAWYWVGNWLGDAAAAGTWFNLGSTTAGVTFQGNIIGGNTSYADIGISMSGVDGFQINGNYFTGVADGINAPGAVTGGVINGNQFVNVIAPLGAAPSDFLWTNVANNVPSLSSIVFASGTGNLGMAGYYLTNQTSGTTLTSLTVANITTLTLSPGTWDVSGSIQFAPASGTTTTALYASIGTTSGALGGLGYENNIASTIPAGAGSVNLSTPTVRLNLTASTTIYLVGDQAFSGSTMTANGFIRATQVVAQ